MVIQEFIKELTLLSPHQIDKKLRLVGMYGLFKHAIDQSHGGNGDSFFDLITHHKDLGKSTLDSSLLLSINAHLWGAIFPIYYFGTIEQKSQYLNPLMDGKLIGGHAITEAQAGSNVALMEMQADSIEHGFRLHGSKRYITNAPISDILLIYAKTGDTISAFIIEKQDQGVYLHQDHRVTGFPNSAMGEIVLHDCKIAHNRLVGQMGTGQVIIQKVLELERAFIFAGISGIMEWQLEQVIRYTKSRQVGKQVALYDLQATYHKIADISMKLKTVALWLHRCAELKDSDARITLESSYTKLACSEVFLQVSIDISHMLGAFGLEVNQPFSQWILDGLASRILSGTSEIQKNIISALL